MNPKLFQRTGGIRAVQLVVKLVVQLWKGSLLSYRLTLLALLLHVLAFNWSLRKNS